MKPIQSIIMLALLWLTSSGGQAALTIPGADGSDGALNITTNTTIDLGLAVLAPWDANNTANSGKGVYDSNKWAVVFKYSSVNIGAGATVTFKNHYSRAPVVWLVSGSVTNGGTINLDGAYGDMSTAKVLEGGPGGFRAGARDQGMGVSGGFGPGGAYDTHGQYGPGQARTYGNAQILPLIGGSGGAASTYAGNSGNYRIWNGGGGGGAILIAASENIAVSGTGRITANGGSSGSSYGGSGGAIRLIADHIAGAGRLEALGAYIGRIRFEGNVVSQSLSVAPPTPQEIPDPVIIWPNSNAPIVRVVSVSGQEASRDPKAILENNPADLTVASFSSVTILLETINFPTNGTVNVFVRPRNSAETKYQAAWVSGTTEGSTWQVQHALLPGYSIIQARAVAP